MKINQKELRDRIKSEKALLRDLKSDERIAAKATNTAARKVAAQEKLVARLEAKKK